MILFYQTADSKSLRKPHISQMLTMVWQVGVIPVEFSFKLGLFVGFKIVPARQASFHGPKVSNKGKRSISDHSRGVSLTPPQVCGSKLRI